MNIFDRIKLRQTIMMFQLLIERIISLFKKYLPEPKVQPSPQDDPESPKPKKRRRPLKKIIDIFDEESKNDK
jgi:hypothetical protein